MLSEIKGRYGKIVCNACPRDQFWLPNTSDAEVIIQCKCGTVMGPLSSLIAKANREGHTSVNANLRPLS